MGSHPDRRVRNQNRDSMNLNHTIPRPSLPVVDHVRDPATGSKNNTCTPSINRDGDILQIKIKKKKVKNTKQKIAKKIKISQI